MRSNIPQMILGSSTSEMKIFSKGQLKDEQRWAKKKKNNGFCRGLKLQYSRATRTRVWYSLKKKVQCCGQIRLKQTFLGIMDKTMSDDN